METDQEGSVVEPDLEALNIDIEIASSQMSSVFGSYKFSYMLVRILHELLIMIPGSSLWDSSDMKL